MADWTKSNANIEADLSSVASMFEARRVSRMYQIAELYPTKISKLLGINSDRYSVKLSNPEKFTVSEILRFAYILGIDPDLVFNVIQKETEKRMVSKSETYRKKFVK